jgi:hypothetical protein
VYTTYGAAYSILTSNIEINGQQSCYLNCVIIKVKCFLKDFIAAGNEEAAFRKVLVIKK